MIDIIVSSIGSNAEWTWRMILGDVAWYKNYFYALIIISFAVWMLEIIFPWRKNQSIFRKDFWLDVVYMFFNFFVFAIAITWLYELLELGFSKIGVGMKSLAILDMRQWHVAWQLLVFFVVLDFVQWLTHVALHRFPWMWRFHQVHHSVEEMGFAAHLRYHWMENILYKPLKTLGVMLLGGFEPEQAFVVHFVAITIGHLNHSNLNWSYGPLKYIFNNPVLHLWHHSYEIPKGHKHGVNYAISLSLWDYLFKTAAVPERNGDIRLGYKGMDTMPSGFFGQLTHGFKSKSK